MKITTTYTPTSGAPLEFPHVIRYPWGVAKRDVFEADRSVKIAITSTLAVVWFIFHVALLAVLSFPLFIIPSVAANVVTAYGLRGTWKYVRQDVASPESRGIGDEVRELSETYQRLLDSRALLPEGTGYHERITQFGKLAYQLLAECERLPSGMDGTNKNFFRVQNEIQTKMKALIASGDELVDLIATRRVENTLASVEHLGIDEYVEHVSIETMAFRALSSGGDDDPKAPTATEPVAEKAASSTKKDSGAKYATPTDKYKADVARFKFQAEKFSKDVAHSMRLPPPALGYRVRPFRADMDEARRNLEEARRRLDDARRRLDSNLLNEMKDDIVKRAEE